VSDDTPTQRMDTPTSSDVHEAIEEEGKKSRGLMIALIAVGALLLIGLIIVLITLLGRNGAPVAVGTTSPTPTVSDTPSETPTVTASSTPVITPTPTATPTTPPPPPSTKPSITGYSISPGQIDCSNDTPNLSIHWKSINGKHAYFGVNTNDAMTGGMGWVLPPTGSDADFPDGYHPFQALCGNDSTEYTITILGNDGSKVSKKFTVTTKN
jgi:predicted nucleic acid-binding Zn ribbon protein